LKLIDLNKKASRNKNSERLPRITYLLAGLQSTALVYWRIPD